MTERPYGSWPSPITAELVVRAAAGLGDVQVDPSTGAIWWSESRPEQGGRIALMRRTPDGTTSEIIPSDMSARTRVHEYGGRPWWVHDGSVWFTNWDDQRIWRLDPDRAAAPHPVTPEPPIRHAWRYADGIVSPDGRWIVCVRESHAAADGRPYDEARNEIVTLPADGTTEPVAIVAGSDFVAAPRLDSSGTTLAWLVWDHPRMPWDGTELWIAELDLTGPLPHLRSPQFVAGGPDESLVQPEWTTDGDLLVVSDRNDWWNLYRVDRRGGLVSLAPVDADVATPMWVFGQSRYAVLDDGTIAMALASSGSDRLALLTESGLAPVPVPFDSISAVRAVPGGIVCIGASFTSEPAVIRIGLGPELDIEILRPPRDLGLDPAWLSSPNPISFPTSGGRTAHALYYPPTNPTCEGPDEERPPLLVSIHGGPTGSARSQLVLGTQFWTSRGIGVVDVNYGGSTGYGRPFRRQLDGQWGVVDVDDCVAAAEHLVAEGLADPDRLLIHGGSAGGFTTLSALAFRETFSAGASSYGVADLQALARDTHKFESRYLDGLIGPLPEAEAIYRERSPIHHLDGFDRPLIVFQGAEDEIVPPDQSQAIVDALAAKGVPVAYLVFDGEQHGFRQAANIRRSLEAELWFYGAMLGFEPADDVEPVPVIGH
jgi:dipeptidyl aminopeptidase/acylaminoacyl peptidase